MALGRSRFDAHLARVTDPRPLVLPLTGSAATSGIDHDRKQREIHLVVKLRPNLLQYIVNGCVRVGRYPLMLDHCHGICRSNA